MRRKKKKKLWRPIVLGFGFVYLTVMGLSTWLTGMKFREELKENLLSAISSAQSQIMEHEMTESPYETYDEEARLGYYQYLASSGMEGMSREFQQMSWAIYSAEGELLAQTENMAGTFMASEETGRRTVFRNWTLEMLEEEELEELAWYEERSYGPDSGLPVYRILARTSRDSGELCGILVEKLEWTLREEHDDSIYVDPYIDSAYSYETMDGKDYVQTGCEAVWEWTASGAEEAAWVRSTILPHEVDIYLPYLISGGRDRWKHWSDSAFLRGFEEKLDVAEVEKDLWGRYQEFCTDDSLFQENLSIIIPAYTSSGSGETLCYVEVRAENHPWLATFSYLKYGYLCGLLLTLVSMGIIIRVMNRIYDQQAALEEMRRNFTNAMAHELKTPLGVIRGFAENLQEGVREDKRDYYLSQIVAQTEEMDELVLRMIEVSKMESEELVLQKEPISMGALIKEQMERFGPALKEKKLRVEYDCGTDFQVEGDREYLEKAVFNLISNAVSYNVPEGSIRVRTQKDSFSMENTGFPLSEEDLSHAFDMFYRGEKSRTDREAHMGMGLFLTKKILDLHGLTLTIENTADGVRAVIVKS